MAHIKGPDTKGIAAEQPLRIPGKGIIDETREIVHMLTLTKKFSESPVGRELLQLFDLSPEGIDTVFEYEVVVMTFIHRLSTSNQEDTLQDAVPFFRLLAMKDPALYRRCLKYNNFNPGLRERLRSIN